MPSAFLSPTDSELSVGLTVEDVADVLSFLDSSWAQVATSAITGFADVLPRFHWAGLKASVGSDFWRASLRNALQTPEAAQKPASGLLTWQAALAGFRALEQRSLLESVLGTCFHESGHCVYAESLGATAAWWLKGVGDSDPIGHCFATWPSAPEPAQLRKFAIAGPLAQSLFLGVELDVERAFANLDETLKAKVARHSKTCEVSHGNA